MKYLHGALCFVVFLALSLPGCDSDPFPVGESFTAGFQVPLVSTYSFNFKSGSGEIVGTQSNLKIVSGADIKNLIIATPGVSEQSDDLGVLSGRVVDRFAQPIPNVSIGGTDEAGVILRNPDGTVTAGVTDANGNIISLILYNSINGVPEFINTAGTAESGSFTALNVPPGEHFIKAVQGGRGNARVNIFAGSISLIDMDIFPVVLPTVSVTGVIRARDQLTAVGIAEMTFPGVGGVITTAENSSFSASGFGSESTFLAKIKAAAHMETYQQFFTDLDGLSISGITPEVTKNLTAIPNVDFQAMLSSAGVAFNPGLGAILGKLVEVGVNGTGKKDSATIIASDPAGNNVGQVFYFPEGGNLPICNAVGVSGCLSTTSTEGKFLIVNLPPGDVYLKAHATVLNSGSNTLIQSSGSTLVSVFTNSISMTEFSVEAIERSDGGRTVALSGFVREVDGVTTVNGVGISVVSVPATIPNSNPDGSFTIAKGLGVDDLSPLLANSVFFLRLEKSGTHVPTYQAVATGRQDQSKDLTIVSSALMGATAGKGAILGRVINRRLGGRVNNISISATQMLNLTGKSTTTGDAIGTVSYFATSTTLDPALTATSEAGLFLIRGLPPGLVMIQPSSSDDSGNQIVRVFPDAVTFLGMPLNHVPTQVPVQGFLSDLHNNPVSGATLSILGERSSFSSEALATAPGVLVPANGSFIAKVEKSGFIETLNYQLKTGLNEQTGLQLFTSSPAELTSLAAQGGLSLDLGQGIIAGQATERTIVDTAPPIATAGTHPNAIATASFNGDIFPDLAVVVKDTASVEIFLGKASGGFDQPNPASLAVGTDPSSIGVGDFNADGFSDIVVSNRGDDSLSVLFGKGEGKFSIASLMTSVDGIGVGPIFVKVTDLNLDGRLDLVVANETSNDLSILFGDGSGGFSTFGSSCLPTCAMEGGPVDIAAADFDTDGKLDLAVANAGSSGVNLLLSGDGVASDIVFAGAAPSAVATGDLNGDGFADLVVLNSGSESVSTFKGDGNGAFTKVDCNPGFDAAADVIDEDCPHLSGSKPRAMRLFDFDKDGRLDLAVVNEGLGSVSISLGKGDGRFDPPSKFFGVGLRPVAMTTTDFNQDGLDDFAIINNGSDNFSLLVSEKKAVENVTIEVRDPEGKAVGITRYMDASFDVDPALTTTSSSGRFIIFDLPFGINMLKGQRALASALPALTGNALVNITKFGTLLFTDVDLDVGAPASIKAIGVTCRPVGLTCAKIGKTDISFLGTSAEEICPPGPKCTSDEDTGKYAVTLDPHSTYIVRLIGPNAVLPGDSDGDGVKDQNDNCPNIPNADQVDENGNQVGDACEQQITDGDGDEINDEIDNCPFTPNFSQEDTDNDGIGDACDQTPTGKPAASKNKAEP